MAQHAHFTIDTGIHVYFCDPHAPGSAAPTRTPTACYASTSPKAPTSAHVTQADLDAVADSLNNRPRKTLGYKTPLESFTELLLASTA